MYPRDRGDCIILELAQFRHPSRSGVPHVHTGAQSDTKYITTTPVNEIQIKVVSEIWSIEYFERDFADKSGCFARAEKKALAVKANW